MQELPKTIFINKFNESLSIIKNLFKYNLLVIIMILLIESITCD